LLEHHAARRDRFDARVRAETTSIGDDDPTSRRHLC